MKREWQIVASKLCHCRQSFGRPAVFYADSGIYCLSLVVFSCLLVFPTAVLGVRKALFNASRLVLFPSFKEKISWPLPQVWRFAAEAASRPERKAKPSRREAPAAAKQPFGLASLAILFRISLSGFLYIYLPFFTFYALVTTLKSLAIKVFITRDLLLKKGY
ncbi:hypothetical protein [Candidatus Electronema sp. PJ]|uniref:hypothetical protein n=1 Tax=Candidatus Electronema sp. PJ TaxID=3401572 RepID=UPI003AA96551